MSLSELVEKIDSCEPKNRPTISEKLSAALQIESPTYEESSRLVTGLADWLKANNFKVVLAALSLIKNVVEIQPDACNAHVPELVPAIRENFADSHETVREECLDLLMSLMSDVSTPQIVYDGVAPGLAHKIPRVRQYSLICLEKTINKFGDKALKIGGHVKTMGGLIGDRDADVREASMSTLVEVYRNVGNRIRRDLGKLDGIPPAKMQILNERFDAVLHSGTMTVSASNSAGPAKPTSSAKSRTSFGTSGKPPGSRAAVGGVDPAEFQESMTTNQAVYICSNSELEAEFREFNTILSDDRAEWVRRVAVCKRMRGLIDGGAAAMPGFLDLVCESAPTLVTGLTDLRSQVSKETCITVSHLSNTLEIQFEGVAKACAVACIKQCAINVKVISESSILCLKNMYGSCHSPVLLKVLLDNFSDKSPTIRRRSCELILEVTSAWATSSMKKHSVAMGDMLYRAIQDADAGVREVGRAAYWAFEPFFSTVAADVMKKLDHNKQKTLLKDKDGTVSATSRPVFRKPKKTSSTTSRDSLSSPDPDSGCNSRPSSRDGSASARSSVRSMSEKSVNSTGPQRVGRQPTGSTVKAEDLNRSGPRRVQTSSAGSTRGTAGTALSSARTAKTPGRVPAHTQRPASQETSVTFSERLAEVIVLSESSDWSSRMEAIEELKDLLHSETPALQRDVRKLSDYFAKQFTETHHRVFAKAVDSMCDFIVIFKGELTPSWVHDCMAGLLVKQGSELGSGTFDKVSYALELIRGSFDVNHQIIGVFKMITDGKISQNVKVRLATMEYLSHLLSKIDTHGDLSTFGPDYRVAIQKLVQFGTEPKSAELRRLAGQNVAALFERSPSQFSDMITKFPSAAADATDKVLTVQIGDWKVRVPNRAVTPNQSKSKVQSNGDFDLATDNMIDSKLSSNVEQFPGGLLPERNYLGHGPQSSTEAFDLVANMGGNDDLLGDDEPSALNVGLGYNPSAYQDNKQDNASSHMNYPGSRGSSVSPSSHRQLASPKPSLPRSVLPSVPRTLRGIAERIPAPFGASVSTRCAALQELVQLSKDQSPMWGNGQFHFVLNVVIDTLGDEMAAEIRDLSLRVLREMLKNQYQLFGDSINTVVRELLKRHDESDREVLRSAEETLSVVANCTPPVKCVQILEPIVLLEDGQVLLAAIKLLTKVLKKVSTHDMHDLVGNTVPGLIKGYKHPLAEVRKGVVFALVEIHLVLGEALQPHLQELSSSQTKLLAIYVKRAEERLSSE